MWIVFPEYRHIYVVLLFVNEVVDAGTNGVALVAVVVDKKHPPGRFVTCCRYRFFFAEFYFFEQKIFDGLYFEGGQCFQLGYLFGVI